MFDLNLHPYPSLVPICFGAVSAGARSTAIEQVAIDSRVANNHHHDHSAIWSMEFERCKCSLRLLRELVRYGDELL